MTVAHPVNARNVTAPAANYPKVRRIKFRFGEPHPMKHHFVEGDIAFSHFLVVLSGAFPRGEESFIRAVRRYADQLTDPVLKKRVAGFIGQESVHGQQHRALNEKLIEMGYRFPQMLAFPTDSRRHRLLVRIESRAPLVHLAMTALAEHYTAIFAERVLSLPEIQAIRLDLEVRNIFNWHAVEELEHKSVAIDVYRAVGGPEWLRICTMALMYVSTYPLLTFELLLSIATDPRGWHPITVARQIRALFRGPLFEGLMADLRRYMKPGFHPDDIRTDHLVDRWRRELFGAQGSLVGHLK